MSTLVQIESAVARLPPQDQWSLLTWLQGRLITSAASQTPRPAERKEWLSELRNFREQCATGKSGTPVEQLINEIRS